MARTADGSLAPLAGQLSPHGTVRLRTHEGRWDDVVGLGFAVVLRDADPAALLRPDQLQALAAIGAHLVSLTNGRGGERVVDVDGRFGNFLKANSAAGLVVRPDFYVFGAATTPADLAALVDELLATLAAHGVQEQEELV